MPAHRQIISRALRHAGSSRRRSQVARDFIRHYLAGVPLDDLAQRTPADLAGAALCHFNLAQKWRSGHRRIRVYNPQRSRDGWESEHSVIEIVSRNSAFLVDSVSMEINRHGYVVHLIIHPMMGLERDRRGNIRKLIPADQSAGDANLVSLIHAEIDRETDASRLRALERDLNRVLEDVRVAVRDWSKIVDKVEAAIPEVEAARVPEGKQYAAECADFLRWLLDDNFTFLGYRDYDLAAGRGRESLRVVPGSGLGILRQAKKATRSSAFDRLPPQLRRLARQKTLLTLSKTDSRATVHRPAYLDYVGVRRFDSRGNVTGERRLLGLYTSQAYMSRPRTIPVVRGKISEVMRRSGLKPSGHAGKVLLNVLDTCPKDELFQASADDLYATAMGIVELQERQQVRLFARQDPFERFIACLVFVPKERFHSGIRLAIQSILREAFDADSVDFTTSISESVYAQLYLVVHTVPGKVPRYDLKEIESRVAAAARTWQDDLQQELRTMYGEERGNELFSRYDHAFSAAYREDHSGLEAAHDIRTIDAAIHENTLKLSVYRDPGMAGHELMFKLYNPDQAIPLSEALPMLENMGLFVTSQRPYEVDVRGGRLIWVHDYAMRHCTGGRLDISSIKAIFQEAFDQVWHGRVENDGFNGLVLAAGLSGREIVVLRAFSKYIRQIGTAFSQKYIEDTLCSHAPVARLLVELFHARFDPDAPDDRKTASRRLESRIETALDAVDSLDEDRILRRFYDLIRATLRTNFYQVEADGSPKSHVALKLASRSIPDLPPPYPRYEVFVYSPRVEGIHLRGGKVARGGLRWSDRREDFRTEVLGLMKAQMVKNAVIVPVGAKGGFYVKQPPAGDPAAIRGEGVHCYKVFIRALLDVTDNRVRGAVVPPPRVVRYDDDDPYLVVAADKGTAAFSDIANGVAAEYGFWLGDAFASGGSAGYDHKKMGITARGAWESVKHHFQGLGVDVQKSPFTVVGIGDMSGDVFGNGMLLSRKIRLVGAFNHQHIFIDPDPDAEAAFRERRRLFRLPASTWADYDAKLISRGGGVFSRRAKSIPLSADMRKLLGTNTEKATPAELIRLLLCAEVDLIWNGGIGTYIRADGERDSDVGDKTNDELRVAASRLRCKVIGEGGNLGITQRGRIAFAEAGGRVNADWIDNSGGVACSDREVNIKILLNAVVASGRMTVVQRDKLLRDMTREVSALVLQDNYRQARAITVSETESRRRLGWYGQLMEVLDRMEDFSRDQESLPDAAALEKRRAAQAGLGRPEVAVLLAQTKRAIFAEILRSSLPDQPYMEGMLLRYFPEPLREKFTKQIAGHQLRREIIATVTTNSMVNRAGLIFAHRLAEESGAGLAEVSTAYLVARDVYELRRLWDEIDGLDHRVDFDVQLRLVHEAQHLLRHSARWYLRRREFLENVGESVRRFRDGADAVKKLLPEILPAEEWSWFQRQIEEFAGLGVPDALAREFGIMRIMLSSLEISRLALVSGHSVEFVTRCYFTLGSKLRMQRLHEFVNGLYSESTWRDRARTDLIQDLHALQADLTADALDKRGRSRSAGRVVDQWFARNEAACRRYLETLEDMQTERRIELEMLSVAAGKLRVLRRAPDPR